MLRGYHHEVRDDLRVHRHLICGARLEHLSELFWNHQRDSFFHKKMMDVRF